MLLPHRPAIDIRRMQNISYTLGYNLRLALLLLMLASQGIAGAHELDASHLLDSHPCSICVLGHGAGAAVCSRPEAPQLPSALALAPSPSTSDVLVAHSNYYSSRAPPATL